MDLLVLTQSISSVGFFLFVSTGLANLWLGYLVLKHNPKGASNRIFFLLSIIIFLWLFVSYASLLSVFVSTSLIWIRLTIFFAVPLCLFVYFFSYSIPKGKFDIGMGNLIVILSITGLVMLVTISPYAFTSIDLVDNFPSPVPGYGLPIFVLYVIISISSSVRLLIIKLKKATGVARMQISFILLGIILMFSLILFTLVLPVALISDATFVSFSPLYTLIFLGLTAYTIIKLRLLEIRFVLSRSIAYTILSVLISALFVLVTFLTSTYFSSESQIIQIGILILSSLFVVLILDPAKSLLAKVTDKIFFKAAINYPVVTKELSDVINEEIQLTGLISRFSITLQRDLRIESVRVLLPKDDVYVPYTVSGNKDNSISISANSYLVSELMKTDSVLLLDELDRKVALANERSILIKYTQIRILFEANNIYCIVPITTDQQLVSILVLSQKLSGETFSRNDVQLLDVVAPQMASGIQKARLYEEERQFGMKLQHEIKKATADLRVANKQLKQLDKAKSEFMSIASHQLRTPLAGIIGYLSMILEGDYGKIDKEQKEVITDVFQAGQRLVRLVNTFLNVTRIEAGRLVLNFVPSDLVKMVEDEIKELQPTADKKGIKLIFIEPKEEVIEAQVDEKIREVFINLIDNAIKYTPEGSVSVGIEKKGKNEFHYYVKDTGVGVAPSEAGKLFNKFVRGSDIALVQPDGSGLGLFIVKRVVEGHNGKVWAESEGLGKGTTFHVVISLKQKDKLHQIEKETVFRSTTKLKEDKKKHNKTKPSTKAKIRKSTKPKK